MLKDSKSLEVSCYVLGAGAFGVFFRWMQLMLAYNEAQMPDRSAWNVFLPLLMLAAALVYRGFIKKMKAAGDYIPDSYFSALSNPGKFYGFFRWVIGIVMVAGSALLLAQCEVDRNATFLRIVAAFGILTGVAFPLTLSTANRPHVTKSAFATLLAIIPILLLCIWLLTCYKQNSINPIAWDYVPELAAIIVTLLAFFRIAGFAYGVPEGWKSLFLCMLGGSLCIMTLSDKRYMGEQVMFAALGLMQVMFVWILVDNRRNHKDDEQAAAEEQYDEASSMYATEYEEEYSGEEDPEEDPEDSADKM